MIYALKTLVKTCTSWNEQQKNQVLAWLDCAKDFGSDNDVLTKENELAKSLLYCTKRTCDNCGFVTCENFQRQRRSNPCALYISYQDRIKNLSHENDVLVESYNNSEMNLASVSDQLTKAKEIIREFMRISVASVEEFEPELTELINEAEKFLKESR